jgi:hypothetical protein
MNTAKYVVVVSLPKGLIIKAVNLSWDDAHDFREQLERTGLYKWVSVGSVDTYFAA